MGMDYLAFSSVHPMWGDTKVANWPKATDRQSYTHTHTHTQQKSTHIERRFDTCVFGCACGARRHALAAHRQKGGRRRRRRDDAGKTDFFSPSTCSSRVRLAGICNFMLSPLSRTSRCAARKRWDHVKWLLVFGITDWCTAGRVRRLVLRSSCACRLRTCAATKVANVRTYRGLWGGVEGGIIHEVSKFGKDRSYAGMCVYVWLYSSKAKRAYFDRINDKLSKVLR